MKNKKSTYNLLASLSYKIGTCIIGLLIPRLFVISYGSELNGLQSSVSQIFAYIGLIEAGVGEAALQSLFGPVSKKNYKQANAILSATTYYYNKIGVIYFCILGAIAFAYPVVVQVESVSYITVVAYILFSGLTTGINFYYQAKIILVLQAEGDMYINSLVTMGVYFLTSFIKIAFILAGFNIVAIQIGFFASNLLGTCVYYRIAKKKYKWIDFHEKPDMGAISQKNAVLIHKISGIVFQNTDIIILTLVCGLKVVSIYTMYKLVINMVTTIVASFGDSFNYIFGQTFNGDRRNKYESVIDTFNVFYSAIAFALFTITNILILPFLRLYTQGMDINYIYPILPYLYIGIEVLQVGREAMLRTITVAGHFQRTLYAAIVEMIINITVSLGTVFIFKHLWGDVAGLYGVLMGTIVALLYRTLDINRYANRIILNRSSFKTNKLIVINIFAYIIIMLITGRLDLEIASYIDFIVDGVLISVVVLAFYLFVQGCFNPKEVKEFLLIIKKKKAEGEV